MKNFNKNRAIERALKVHCVPKNRYAIVKDTLSDDDEITTNSEALEAVYIVGIENFENADFNSPAWGSNNDGINEL